MTEAARSSARADVIVAVHGGWDHVRQCLTSLQAQTVPCRVIVVDDASPDDTLSLLRAEFADLDILHNAVNGGFALTCNIGIRAGSAEIVILVNSDVVARPDMVESILARFDEDESGRAASVSPLLLADSRLVDSYGITADRTLAGFVRFHGGSPDDVADADPVLLGPYGAVAAYRRTALDAVGLLDENIFMYGEELDLALRLRAGGWGALALHRVVGEHAGGATAGRGSKRQRYLSAFGRGYVVRVYSLLKTKHAARALATEMLVSVIASIQNRDLAAISGRIAGWRKARAVPRRRIPDSGLDGSISFGRSLAMRRPDYWVAGTGRTPKTSVG